MSFKTFMIGLIATFGVPLLLLVVVPHAVLKSVDPLEFTEKDDGREGIYVPKRPGRIEDGAAVYAAEGCYICHTQLIRPTFAGSDVWRPDWAGLAPTVDQPVDTRRETNIFDYRGEDFAQIGLTRTGPDLSNVGLRVDRYAAETGLTPENWLYWHLWDARAKPATYWSVCPSYPQLFKTVPDYGQAGAGLPLDAPDGKMVVPSDRGRALVSYLLSLKKNDQVPYSINYRRNKKRASEQ
ncbi:MAG: hypothetical protein HKO57_17800 [Akkermansiaceae bacterium]|nr:hypothetical protein [Akkermansiaceae bacterium]